MMRGTGARFWQPAPEVATELVGACFEASEGQPHVHEEWQFAVLETPSRLTIGAYRSYRAHADDVTIVPPYAVHSEGAKEEIGPKWRVLYVAPSIVSQAYGGQLIQVNRPVVTDPAAAAELRQLLRLSSNGTLGGSEFLARVVHWLERFLLIYAEAVVTPRQVPAVERARAYLQSRPTELVNLSEVSAAAGVNMSYLTRAFSRSVGLPPKSYHAQVRLARARRLLAEGKSATWVAYECGFADQSHLSRRFKECHGVTPGAFQEQYRSRSSPHTVEPTAA